MEDAERRDRRARGSVCDTRHSHHQARTTTPPHPPSAYLQPRPHQSLSRWCREVFWFICAYPHTALPFFLPFLLPLLLSGDLHPYYILLLSSSPSPSFSLITKRHYTSVECTEGRGVHERDDGHQEGLHHRLRLPHGAARSRRHRLRHSQV